MIKMHGKKKSKILINHYLCSPKSIISNDFKFFKKFVISKNFIIINIFFSVNKHILFIIISIFFKNYFNFNFSQTLYLFFVKLFIFNYLYYIFINFNICDLYYY